MNPYRYAAYAVLCAILVGCASIGLTPAKSLSDRIAYAYGVNAGVRTAAANSLNAGNIKVEDAEYVLKVSDESRAMLDASKAALTAGDASTAEGRLVLALGVLDALQSYLNSKVKP